MPKLEREQVYQFLRGYIVEELLDGDGADLEADSPLLEWGVINSLELRRITSMVRDQLGVDLSLASPRDFRSLDALTTLILQASGAEHHD